MNITYGYNKDGRPDLKQFLYSLLVSKEGVPIWGAIRDGNKSDKNLNREVIDEISKAMTQEALKDMIYTGDSALVTKKNFRKLDEQGLQFITRFPKTFSECERTKLQALGEEDGWINIGRISEKKDGANYQIKELPIVVEGTEYRGVVVRSDRLDKAKEKTLQKMITREKTN